MRDDPNIPWLKSLAAMQHYARQRWPHDPAIQIAHSDYGSGIDVGKNGTVPETLTSF
jgi:hypothetical protein